MSFLGVFYAHIKKIPIKESSKCYYNNNHLFNRDELFILGIVTPTGRNLLDTKYIERGTDGKTHDLDSFTDYWGAARTMSFGFRLSM